MPAEARFDAMGSWAHVLVVGGSPSAVDRARARIEQLEARWSRFRPDSEVSRLNRAEGRPVVVSADTVALVSRGLAGWRGTAGRFDPTVLGPMLDNGYDRPFTVLVAELAVAGGRSAGVASGLATGAAAVAVDARVGTVALPGGVGFDPGGIGKGLAADLVVAELLAEGADGACVNLGGDLRAEGAGPWRVDVTDPFDGVRPPLASLAFDAGGVATSSRLRRAWQLDGTARHHVIDPTSGRPATSGVAAATVLTGDAWRAEVLATAALVAGVAGAVDLIASARAAGLVVDDAGMVHPAGDLAPYLV